MIDYKNNKPFIEGVSIEEIAKNQATPFYLYSQSKISEAYNNLESILKSEIFYAVKANSNQAIIKLLSNLGAGADVVSLGELKRAINVCVNPKKIIFEGLGKTKHDIVYAIEKKIRLINIESIDELQRINEVALSQNKKVDVGIRLNPNITGKTNKKISTGGKNDKFGLSYNNCINLCKKLKKMKNLKLEGISVHIGSQIIDIHPFKQVLKTINKIIAKTKMNFNFIDLGGGIGISYSDSGKKFNLNKYAKLVNKFTKDKNTKIIFEPGRFVVGNTSILISKIIKITFL